jgi:hypothetical protein
MGPVLLGDDLLWFGMESVGELARRAGKMPLRSELTCIYLISLRL